MAAIRYFMSHANVHGENMLYILLVSHLKSIYDFRRTISSSISLIQFCPSVNKIKKRDPFSILENQIPETILTDALYHPVYSTIRLTS